MNLNSITSLRISLASPEQIRQWSHGEVTKPDTLNYLTNKPEKGGLFCERIFGPLQDWTCACRKYRRKRSPGFVCERCGVEVAPSLVRRERMGHIELVAPVVHSWFAYGVPSILALLLDCSPRQLARVLATTGYLVTRIDHTERDRILSRCNEEENKTKQSLYHLLERLSVGDFLDEAQYHGLVELAGNCFHAHMGAEAIQRCLVALDLTELATSLREAGGWGKGNPKKSIKRLHPVEDFPHFRGSPGSEVDPGTPMLSP